MKEGNTVSILRVCKVVKTSWNCWIIVEPRKTSTCLF